ncbi:hypothetical protein J2R96_006308 [Bradyrhizobium elkanii]|uniref:Uncharacterized protein n=1 Tax=Bradyrhizobium brasilense TaxID=1419277 RepID=A0ABY8JPE4_9BRAD|nr:hypothetical protein [Bradyrhizobium brasilense]MCP1913828.1 hypothetical protein [Bradyrhizobium elkanii]WFU66195.1 hypothetical protein QA636_12060 [Bradyrhizobium brasilense]
MYALDQGEEPDESGNVVEFRVNELASAWLRELAPYAMIAIGFVLVLASLIARSRQKRSEAEQVEEEPRPVRPQMASLPHLLSSERRKGPDAD